MRRARCASWRHRPMAKRSRNCCRPGKAATLRNCPASRNWAARCPPRRAPPGRRRLRHLRPGGPGSIAAAGDRGGGPDARRPTGRTACSAAAVAHTSQRSVAGANLDAGCGARAGRRQRRGRRAPPAERIEGPARQIVGGVVVQGGHPCRSGEGRYGCRRINSSGCAERQAPRQIRSSAHPLTVAGFSLPVGLWRWRAGPLPRLQNGLHGRRWLPVGSAGPPP